MTPAPTLEDLMLRLEEKLARVLMAQETLLLAQQEENEATTAVLAAQALERMQEQR